MKYRALAVVPLGLALLFAAVELTAGAGPLPSLLGCENELCKLLGLAGALAATLAFERGDYMRRAWAYGAGSMTLLLVNDAFRASAFATTHAAHDVALAAGAISLLANAAAVVSTFMLARAWDVAGLDDADAPGRGHRRAMFGGTVVLSLAVTGWPLTQDLVALSGGHAEAILTIASDLGDAICLALLAPVMFTALAMRGGSLLWPWGLLTACGVSWVAYDIVVGMVDVLHAAAPRWLIAIEGLRALANLAYCSSGVAQRLGRP